MVRLVASTVPELIKTRRLLAAIWAFVGFTISSTGRSKVPAAYPFKAANYYPGFKANSVALRVFSFDGSMVNIALASRLGRTLFGPNGKSLYGTNASSVQEGVIRESPGLSRIEFQPARSSLVPGTGSFNIKSFALTARQDKLIISGSRHDGAARECGIFEIGLPDGNTRQVLKSDCRYQWSWDKLSLSPDGAQAIATVGSNTDHDLHLELIDLAHGTAKSVGSEFWMGVWSPNGKWIAMLGDRNYSLVLIEPGNFSRRRSLGSTSRIRPEWSPDSRYLLLWKYHLFRCGIGIDVEPPATLEILDTESGKRSTIQSSQCQLVLGSTGWVSSEIAN